MNDLLSIFANTADGVFAVNEAQRIIYWNQAAQEMLGYAGHDVMGQLCYKVLRGCDDKGQVTCRHQCPIARTALAGGTVPNYDLAVRTKAGALNWLNISIVTFSSPTTGTSPIVVHLFRDATKAKQNEQFIAQMFDTVGRWQNELAPPPALPPADRRIGALTERERETLDLLAKGLTTADIAESLSISPATVRNHIQNLLHKLDVHSRLEAVTYALEHRLVSRN